MSNIKKAIAILAGISLYASAHAVPVFYSGTGNYYEYVSDSVLSTEAQAAAAANSYLGATGYLATILDAGENTFITNLISDSAWIGLSDATTEGQWQWVDGPEAGDLAVYTNWSAGEPNDFASGEDYTEIRTNGTWNDHGIPHFTNYRHGYVVEYSPVPAPATLALLGIGMAGFGFIRKKRLKQD
jgi:hypothetical protein